jgi:hypothetical protein
MTKHNTVLKRAIQNDRIAMVLTSGSNSLSHESTFQFSRSGLPVLDRLAKEKTKTMSKGSVKKNVR